ncbi:hypothetical protein I0Q91_02110 [Halanaerobiaceae bacterium Z-7014]|uniref:DOMON domain-containing protein n=1 Tax=Halonatronomonas betaini TaxID=2778430 RepID=A0A931ANA0_9FIRM|nr:DOMON domain-containing protein [Halonatronomonas betaini]MBF8435862.1 hypothetical protein [Halonatronomonas betaini]
MSKIFKRKKLFGLVCVLILVPLIIAGCNNNDANNDDVADEEAEVAQESLLTDDLTYTNLYSSDIGLDIYWEFNEDEDALHMMLESPGSGWLSVGFDATTRMNEAKIIIAGFDGDDNFQLEEHIGTSPTSHEQIDEIYITESTGEREEDSSIAEFIIPLDGDSRYAIEPGETYEVIVAFHSDDDSFMQRHTQRASVEIDF